MTILEWDQPGEHFYQAGIDHGVLYLPDDSVEVWNGLVSVEDASDSELKSVYLDGVKILDTIVVGDFSGKLTAITYPEKFNRVQGVVRVAEGLFYHNQPFKHFNLSYRTKQGNELAGLDYGYTIHLLYNLVAVADSFVHETLGDNSAPVEFGWTLSGTPPSMSGYRPTAHISIDSNDTLPAALAEIENILYGTFETEARFPTIAEVATIFGAFGVLVITDNGDGTWTADDVSDDYITMLDDTTFQIHDANATYLDASTYQISTTPDI